MLIRTKRLLREYCYALLWIVPLAFLIRSFGYGLYRVSSGSMEHTMLVGDRFFADKLTIHLNKPVRGDIITFSDPQYKYSHSSLVALIQRHVWGPRNVTKRVIGMPGDHVRGMVEDNKPVIYLNGQRLDEPYVNQYQLIPIDPLRNIWRTYVPDKPYNEQPFYRFTQAQVMAGKKYMERRGRPYVKAPFVATPADHFDVVLGENQYWVMGDNRQASTDSRHWGALDGMFINGKIRYLLWSIDSSVHWVVADILLRPIDFWKKVRWGRNFQKIS
jgi:signal peptidase I